MGLLGRIGGAGWPAHLKHTPSAPPASPPHPHPRPPCSAPTLTHISTPASAPLLASSTPPHPLSHPTLHPRPRRYDEGCVMVKLGREEPVASMDNRCVCARARARARVRACWVQLVVCVCVWMRGLVGLRMCPRPRMGRWVCACACALPRAQQDVCACSYLPTPIHRQGNPNPTLPPKPLPKTLHSGKIIWARHNEVQTVNIKSLGDVEEVRCAALRHAVLCCSGPIFCCRRPRHQHQSAGKCGGGVLHRPVLRAAAAGAAGRAAAWC